MLGILAKGGTYTSKLKKTLNNGSSSLPAPCSVIISGGWHLRRPPSSAGLLPEQQRNIHLTSLGHASLVSAIPTLPYVNLVEELLNKTATSKAQA